MFPVQKIILRDVRVLGRHPDLVSRAQQFPRALRTADAHAAAAVSEIQNFIDLPAFLEDRVAAHDADISSAVGDVGRHVRTFGQEKADAHFFICKDQLSRIRVVGAAGRDARFPEKLQCFTCQSPFRQGNRKITHT